ncbi:MAG TPA: hypothetical protein VJN64_16055 [Terriglobales bacterium]|nr:hypothetical protein [Terriglobales bacterium]
MLAACLLLLLAVISGTLLTFWFDRSAPLAARVAIGACIGLSLLAAAGFVFAEFLGMTTTAVALSAAVLLLSGTLLAFSEYRQRVRDALAASWPNLRHPSRSGFAYLGFYLAIAVLLGLIFGRAVYRAPDGIYTGVTNNLGDLPFHMQAISSFSQGHNFPPQDPTYSGVRFAYPFLVDVEAAMLVRCGAGMISAIWLQDMVLALAMVGLLHCFTLLLTRSRLAGVIAPLLVLFSGGLGWTWIFNDVRNSDHGLLPMLASLPRDYTIAPDSIFRWGNSLTTLFVPQRSILLGVPVALVIFCQWWLMLNNAEQPSRRRMLSAGLLAGLLPLIHAHTFLVVMGVGACLVAIFRSSWRNWIWFFAPAILLALPQVLWLAHSGIDTQSYLGWQLGWDRKDANAVWFWLVNTGLFIPALMVALFWRHEKFSLSKRLLWFYLPFVFCFIIPNVMKLAPWVWDNIKVLFYWYIASAPLVALLLARGLRQKSGWRWIAAGALTAMLLSGGLDVLRVITGTTPQREFNINDISVANAISQKTAPQALVLHAPTYNSPVFLTGRRSLLGYPGWMFSRGLEYQQRTADISAIYSGAPDAAELMRRYHVDYVLIGPEELSTLKVNEQFWSQYPEVAQTGPYRLYGARIQQERARQ